MSAEATTTIGHDADHSHEAHPNRDMVYVKVAAILAVITGIETFTYFESVLDFGRLTMPLLIVCMGAKFYLIAAYFMHLKWDKPILRRTFMVGIVLALAVYIITLTAFRFWDAVDVMPK
ncbi:MAG: cytochrome C oxidase subunit IV family protein [Acidimicrobiia bacterium]